MDDKFSETFMIIVNREDIAKQRFRSIKELEVMLAENNLGMNMFAQITSYIDSQFDSEAMLTDEQMIDIQKVFDIGNDVLRHGLILYNLFRIEFQDKFNLDIALRYHDTRKAHFAIYFDGVYQVSKWAEALQKEIPFDLSQLVVHE